MTNDAPETPADLMLGHPVLRDRAAARELLSRTAPYDPPMTTEAPDPGVLRGGLHYLDRLEMMVPEAGRSIRVALRTTELEQAALDPTHPADVLELAHPPAYQQVLALGMRHDMSDAEVVNVLAGDLARAWEHVLMASSHHLAKGGVEAHLQELDAELEGKADEAEDLLRRTRSLTYLSAGAAMRFSDCYVDVSRELIGGLLTEGNEIHGRMVTGLPEGSELMGAGWVPEGTGTLRLWFKRETEHVVGSPPEAILATVEQTHRPTFSLSRGSNPAYDALVREWLKRARADLEARQGEPEAVADAAADLGPWHAAHRLLDDLEGTLNGAPRV